MGKKRERAIEKLRRNPRNICFDEIDAILLHLGFSKRMKGSHATYTLPGLRPITIPFRKPFILPIYVEQVIQLIDQIEDEDI
jgi:predicted RNA binding protein YcfA (HicA-like mRNA interferase family)